MAHSNTFEKLQVPDLAQSIHDVVLTDYPKPAWLISESLLNHRWVVCLEDNTKIRSANVRISFDVPIAPGRLLTEREFENDLLTAKLLLIHSIRGGSIKDGKVAAMFVRNYLQFVRWRIGIGIYRNADVNDDIMNLLKRTVQKSGISGLPPVNEAFQVAKMEIESGQRTLPTYRKGKEVKFASNQFLAELGVPNMTSLPTSLRAQIRELANCCGFQHESNKPAIYRETVPTANRVANFLSPIFALNKFASKLSHDPVGCVPFQGESRQSVARSVTAREADRSFTVPALQACYLVDRALIWVLDYYPHIRRLVNDVERRATELAGPSGHWRPHERAIRDVLANFEPPANADQPGSPWPIHPAYFEASRGERTRPSLRTVLFEYPADREHHRDRSLLRPQARRD